MTIFGKAIVLMKVTDNYIVTQRDVSCIRRAMRALSRVGDIIHRQSSEVLLYWHSLDQVFMDTGC